MIYYRYMDSPVGRLLVAGDDEGLHRICFPKGKRSDLPESHWVEAHVEDTDVARRLNTGFGIIFDLLDKLRRDIADDVHFTL